ncbi:hypothetical protein ILUMI_18720 [Ignelater luminosus]|uniref:NACHT domain-containing protein n=1 Tax=Ignelater luminosus TaxID=2038154 RepID=A0A8K0CHG2_IGNLU|nr:hypothetical protein ILUMI_18720 [Ignelater luminosus]
MWLATNINDINGFHHIILHKETNQNCKQTYLMNLKYQARSKDILEAQFLSKNGDFSIRTFIEKYINMKKEINNKLTNQSYIINHLLEVKDKKFIIFTNRSIPRQKPNQNKYKFLIATPENELHQLNFGGSIHGFDDITDLFELENDVKVEFMNNLFLFTKQVKSIVIYNAVEKEIRNIFKSINLPKADFKKISEGYMMIIFDWFLGRLGGNYILTKSFVLEILIQLLLEPYMCKIPKYEQSIIFKKNTLWNNIINDNLVIVLNDDAFAVHFLWAFIERKLESYCAKKENIELWKYEQNAIIRSIFRVPSDTIEMTRENVYEYLWKIKEIPLMIEISNEAEFDTILRILETFKDSMHRVFIINKSGEAIKSCNEVSIPVVTTLQDLSSVYQKEILNCQVRFQGGSHTELINLTDEDMFDIITVKDIIYTLEGKLNIGNEFKPFVNFFIERSISDVAIQGKVLENQDEYFFIVCQHVNEFQSYLAKHNIDIQYKCLTDINQSREMFEDRVIIVNISEINISTVKFLKSLHSLHTSVTVLFLKDSNLWIKPLDLFIQTKSIHLKIAVNDLINCILKNFVVSPLIICSDPGTGKSSLINHIRFKFPASKWIIKINAIEYISYYKQANFQQQTSSEYLRYFNHKESESDNILNTKIFEKYLYSKNIILLFDGFDEIALDYKERVSQMLKNLLRDGYFILITTRPIMKSYLEKTFDTCSVITLDLFTNNDQRKYLEYLFTQISENINNDKNLIENYVNKLLNSIKPYLHEFLNYPLHLNILSKLFLDNFNHYLQTGEFRENFDFVLLYETIIQTKIENTWSLYGGNIRRMYCIFKTHRSYYALMELFGKEDLNTLDLDRKLNEILPNIDASQFLQIDGIMIDNDSTIKFAHRIFAEYFAAEWLTENICCNNAKVLFKRMFQRHLTNLRMLFDQMLAKDCLLHHTVLSRQMQEIKKIIDSQELNHKDKGGRTFLHLLASWGTNLKETALEVVNLVPNNKLHDLCQERDFVLGYTPLDYALISENFYVLESLCEKLRFKQKCQVSADCFDLENLLINSTQLGNLHTVNWLTDSWR